MEEMANARCRLFQHLHPADCFNAVYEAVRISVQHMTPVIFLSDGYIANGAEPWKFPTAERLAAYKSEIQNRIGSW